MNTKRVLSVNPGSTSTKIMVCDDEDCIFKENIRHSPQELAPFGGIFDQIPFRSGLVADALRTAGLELSGMDAVVGRGGFLPEPLAGGTYIADGNVCATLRAAATEQHAANLGALIAKSIGDEYGIPAFIVDPVTVNETEPLGKVSGFAGITRRTLFHCLNVKAVARAVAEQLGRPYPALHLVIAHLGGGISVSAHRGGRAVDATCGLLGEGAFSPERAGTLGLKDVLGLAFNSGKTQAELEKLLCGGGGIVSYLGTNDGSQVEERAKAGDGEALLIYEAMAYQVAKDIAAQASVLKGQVDAIVLTAGLAHSEMLTGWIKERVEFIAPVIVLPGEFEHEAMTQGALRVLRGEEQPLRYQGHP